MKHSRAIYMFKFNLQLDLKINMRDNNDGKKVQSPKSIFDEFLFVLYTHASTVSIPNMIYSFMNGKRNSKILNNKIYIFEEKRCQVFYYYYSTNLKKSD